MPPRILPRSTTLRKSISMGASDGFANVNPVDRLLAWLCEWVTSYWLSTGPKPRAMAFVQRLTEQPAGPQL
jgi:hypothetical protein